MIFKKNAILAILLAMMPFTATSGVKDSAVTVFNAGRLVGQASSTVDSAANLTGCSTPEPIATVSTIYNLGSAVHFLGSLGWGIAATPYRLCCGYPQEVPAVADLSKLGQAASAVGTVSSAVGSVSMMQSICKEGYDLTPDSVKWAVDSVVPDSVKQKCNNVQKFVKDQKVLKAVGLAMYVAYKASQSKTTVSTMDVVGGAYSKLQLMRFFYNIVPKELKDGISSRIPACIKSKYNIAKKFVDEHKVLKAAAFAAYVAYNLSQYKLAGAGIAAANSIVAQAVMPTSDAVNHMAYAVLD